MLSTEILLKSFLAHGVRDRPCALRAQYSKPKAREIGSFVNRRPGAILVPALPVAFTAGRFRGGIAVR